ncbi:porin [Sulfuricaulis sp.]|jgi:predicted porin|uniref:porin n=1 Tax=Sulfuricaulis sp. TaxID=2003553 RepID=UPI00355A0ADA
MNKKLLIAAMGATLVAGPMLAAQADTVVYGHFHESMDNYDNGGAAAARTTIVPAATIPAVTDTSNGLLNSNSSRFGIKGNEDLGGGLKAIYQVESGVFNADDGSSGFGNTLRNTYMGFAGSSWGSVKFGRHDTPVKDMSRKIDAFNEEIGDLRVGIGYARFDNRASNMVRYDSPSFSGIQAAVLYSTSEANTDVSPSAAPTTGITSGNVTWSQGPIYLGLGYEVHNYHNSNLKEESDMRLVGMFNITPEFYVAAIYDKVSNLLGLDGIDGSTWGIGAGFKMANNLFKAQYAKVDSVDTANPDDGATVWAIGVDHNFSKTTKVYLDYAKADNDVGQNVNVSSSYAGHGTSSVPAVGAGKSPSAVSLGMVVNF